MQVTKASAEWTICLLKGYDRVKCETDMKPDQENKARIVSIKHFKMKKTSFMFRLSRFAHGRWYIHKF